MGYLSNWEAVIFKLAWGVRLSPLAILCLHQLTTTLNYLALHKLLNLCIYCEFYLQGISSIMSIQHWVGYYGDFMSPRWYQPKLWHLWKSSKVFQKQNVTVERNEGLYKTQNILINEMLNDIMPNVCWHGWTRILRIRPDILIRINMHIRLEEPKVWQ